MSCSLDGTIFKGWIVLTEWSKGNKFHTPGFDVVKRCEHKVRACYMPPNNTSSLNVVPRSRPAMAFTGKVSGKDARVLLDNGATESFLCHSFACQLGVKGEGGVGIVQLGGPNQTEMTHGFAQVNVCLYNCKTKASCLIMDLNPNLNIILG